MPARRSAAAVLLATATALAAAATATASAGAAAAQPRAAGAAAARSGATATAPPYVTILFGRDQDGQVFPCAEPAPGGVSIPTVLQALAAHGGGVGTGVLIVDRTSETSDVCRGGTVSPSWQTLEQWHAQYGFQVVSEGDYQDMTTLTPQQQWQQSCGLLPVFAAHGFSRADGEFAYTDNRYTRTIQSSVVSTCFDFGRTYAPVTNRQAKMAPPYFAGSLSLTGGACNDPAQPCYTELAGKHYVLPAVVARLFAPAPGEWSQVQLYRLVTGRNLAGHFRWDCTSANPAEHWTSQHEDYCWNDVQAALATMPSDVVITDPATVAAAWGRQVSAPGGVRG